jgi:peptide-methionine (S)-S-oxide reductase
MSSVQTTIGWILVAVLFAVGAVIYVYHNPESNMSAAAQPLPENCELATLGGGCFWCLEAGFELLNGVARVESGYTGGATKNPTYQQICSGTTGHAEVVQVAFDPKIISYRDLLQIFFVLHDPTTLNRQGADVGTQYRSAIFYHSPEQKKVAEDLIAELQKDKVWDRPIVTQIAPLETFYKAEGYHQGYFRANPRQPYCQAIVAPKVAKLRSHYLEKLKK